MNLLTFLKANRLRLALVIIPMTLATVYFAFFAADRYVSTSTIIVKQASHESSALPGAALLLAGVTPPSREDTLYVQEYVHSLGLLQRLDKKLNLRAHYQSAQNDPVFSLAGNSTQEEFLDYYRKRIEIKLDDLSSLLTIRVQGFEPSFAQALNQAILDESEHFVNEFSQQIASEQLRFAENELLGASQRVQDAQTKILSFQNKHKMLDPVAQAHASGAVTAELQAQLTKLEAELKGLRSFLQDNAFQVAALKSQIKATRAQLEIERARTTSRGKQGERLSTLALEFQALQLRGEFARDAYKLALGAVENARIDATRKIKSLVIIEPPSRPEEAEYPRRLYNLLTLLVASLLLYAIVRLVVTTIREHQD